MVEDKSREEHQCLSILTGDEQSPVLLSRSGSFSPLVKKT